MQREKFYENLGQFLLKNNATIDLNEINENTDLIKTGLVDSFTLTNLILFIEDMIGKEIPVEDLEIDSIKDFESIYNTFFKEKTLGSN